MKEIVFRSSNPRHFFMPTPLPDIERVESVKLLGVIFKYNLKFNDHVTAILSQCSQRLYLLKLLKKQGLCEIKINIIYNSLVVSRLSYALPAWASFVSAALVDMINSFFKRSHRYNLCSKNYNFIELLSSADKKLFNKIQNPDHCLYFCLPPLKDNNHGLRKKGHNFQLPNYELELTKRSFVTRCLYKFK